MRPLPRWIRFRRVRVLGAAVYLHWSVLVVIAILGLVSIESPIHAAVAIASYLAVVVIHELGHALVASRLGYEVTEVRIGFLHGCCEHEMPDTLLDHVWIAWGGVLAQLAIAIPVLVIGSLTEGIDLGYLSPTIAFLGYFNLLVALLNLAPGPGMDGQIAWRVVPLLRDRISARRKTNSVVTTFRRRR
jgi:Zn-dependent protease